MWFVETQRTVLVTSLTLTMILTLTVLTAYCCNNHLFFKGSVGVPYYRYDKKPDGFVATVCIPMGGKYVGCLLYTSRCV